MQMGNAKSDRFPWNASITAYVRTGREKAALQVFLQMQEVGNVKMDKFGFTSLLSACATTGSLVAGKCVHVTVVSGSCDLDLPMENALITMYGKCSRPHDARSIFDKMRQQDVISWSAMIAAYAHNACTTQALKLFECMQSTRIKPDRSTFVSILSAYAGLGSLAETKLIHKQIITNRYETDTFVSNALIHVYGKCGSPKDAQIIFQRIHRRDVISWTAIITAYNQNGLAKESLELFHQMELDGVKPNKITFLIVLDACASLTSLEQGREIHTLIKASSFDSDIVIGNALLHMYYKCASLGDALEVFGGMRIRDVVSFNTMIAAYAQNGLGGEALELLGQMCLEGIQPNLITFLSTLDACVCLSSLEKGKAIHKLLVRSGFESDLALQNALLHMYSYCSSLEDARIVFDKMYQRDEISWNTMISAYSRHGHGKHALELFRQMTFECVLPNSITFFSVLHGCSHACLLEEALDCFVLMRGGFNIAPSAKHYGCMINLLGRARLLHEVEDLISNMPVQSDALAWTTLLGAYAGEEQGACIGSYLTRIERMLHSQSCYQRRSMP